MHLSRHHRLVACCHVPRAKAPRLAPGGSSRRFSEALRHRRPDLPAGTTTQHEKPGHSGPPAGVPRLKAGIGSACPRRPGDSLPLSLSLRRQTQEGCASPVQPSGPSTASRSPCPRPRARCLGLRGCFVVPRGGHACQRVWAKARSRYARWAFPSTAKAGGLPRLKVRRREGSIRLQRAMTT